MEFSVNRIACLLLMRKIWRGGGIGSFIEDVQPFLVAQGVQAPQIEEEPTGEDYVIRVGGVTHKIYDAAELQEDSAGNKPGHTWGLSMARGFKIVNEMLAKAGSAERVYAVNGGNDLFALFLTPELFRIIMTHPAASPKDGPYQPTEEYPWYGASQDAGRKTSGKNEIPDSRPVKPPSQPWPLWKQLIAAFLLGCVLLGLKLLLFKH
jgi:hypothetical protein